MRIDLHLHSPISSLNGDSIKWKSTLETITTLYKNNVRAFAFTDHNNFDPKLYFEAKKIIGESAFIFPGVEVDVVKRNGVKAHILIIFNNNIGDEEVKRIQKICLTKMNKNGISIETLNDLFDDYETIRIPHLGKGDNFKRTELHEITHDAVETTSLANKDYIAWKNSSETLGKSVVAFSDTHRWEKKLEHDFLFTEIDFDGSFKNLKEKLALCVDYTKTK